MMHKTDLRCYCGVHVTELEVTCWYCHYRHANPTSWLSSLIDERAS